MADHSLPLLTPEELRRFFRILDKHAKGQSPTPEDLNFLAELNNRYEGEGGAE